MNVQSLTYWHSTLQGQFLPIHENHPEEGWYRTRPRKGYRSLPVRIWRDEGSGELLALRDGKRVDPYEIWTWVCLNPVSVEAYEEVAERGGRWPDEIERSYEGQGGREASSKDGRERSSDAARTGLRPLREAAPLQGAAKAQNVWRSGLDGVAPSGRQGDLAALSRYRQIGHNSGSVTGALASPDHASEENYQFSDVLDQSKILTDEIADLKGEVLEWLDQVGPITDQVTADLCANYAEAFADLEKKAEGFRTSAKKPILDQGRAIDQHWKPIVSAAEEAKRLCKKALEPFLIAETERLEREWLEAVKAENGDLSLLEFSSLTAKAGTFGRTISLRRVRKVRVLDRHALLAHYHRDPRFLNDEAVQKLLAKLAEHDLQAGLSVPGAESVEEKVAV